MNQNEKIRTEIFSRINQERIAQNKIWGVQNHPHEIWSLILGEKVGEVQKAVLEYEVHQISDKDNIEIELIQSAAVIVQWLEYIWRQK